MSQKVSKDFQFSIRSITFQIPYIVQRFGEASTGYQVSLVK